jgi:NADPH:quinone reductase-like Zn-dependent oxidoreductase
MRAARFYGYGGLDSIRLEDIACPEAGPGEVVVRVLAAGVNPFDRYAVEGWVNAYVSFTLPATLGRDFSGIVDAVGPGTDGFVRGDAVYGHVDASADGSFAEYVAIPADRAVLKPERLSHVEAAALPNVLMAAWDGLFSVESGADLQAGETILINGATGGIGSLAVQLANWRGARVIGTASQANLDFLRTLGTDQAFDYAAPDWLAQLGRIDAVLDTSAGADAEWLCAHLRPGARYVGLRGLPPAPWAEQQAGAGIRCVVANGPASSGLLPVMAPLVADGTIRPIVSGVLPLSDVVDALRLVGSGHVRGKLVLAIRDTRAE